ncbi:MAG: Ig-like domain-containing protein [Nitrospirae bacterium]|nr:Ig-like domain-containing protein [Nitrospirota bacterium]
MVHNKGGFKKKGGADTTPPTVVSTNPANNATKVTVQSNIQIVVSEGLDSVSVSRATVSLRAGSYKVPSTVTYDDVSRTITINPAGALWYDYKYTITISGVKDLAGNIMAQTTFSFTTYKNPFTRYIYYTALGLVSSYYTYTYDANGNMTRYVYYSGAGADGVWFTVDDVKYAESYYDTSF